MGLRAARGAHRAALLPPLPRSLLFRRHPMSCIPVRFVGSWRVRCRAGMCGVVNVQLHVLVLPDQAFAARSAGRLP